MLVMGRLLMLLIREVRKFVKIKNVLLRFLEKIILKNTVIKEMEQLVVCGLISRSQEIKENLYLD